MKISRTLIPVLALIGTVAILRAAGEAKTITGEAKCAKVDLKSQDKCQTVIQVKEGANTVSYYVVANEVAKPTHAAICGHPQKVTAVGTVAVVDGKTQLTVTKINVVK